MSKSENELKTLIDLIKESRIALVRLIVAAKGAGSKTYYATILRQLEGILNGIQRETGRYINTAIPAAYQKALMETYEYFKRNGLRMRNPEAFAQLHQDAVHELVREMQYNIQDGISQIGRRVMRYLDVERDQSLRQAGLKASAQKALTGTTTREAQAKLMQELTDKDFVSVQYGAGKRAYQVPLETYTEMVARSTTREAGNLARENQLSANGYDLVKMTEHYPTCSVCAALQGRVYSISGEDPRFPPLSRAFSSGYKNVHPNCRHVITPWIEELQSPEEIQEAMRKSTEPFDDPRSQEERALYSKQQADNRRLRADLYQYERYKARLGADAPKSFGAFRRIKKQNGAKWIELQKAYESDKVAT